MERYLISGAMRRRRHAQKGVVQWSVERRMEGRVWKMDCWVCIDGDVVDVGDVGGGGGVA